MVAVHIRRGDYAQIRDSLAANSEGWLLPMCYYESALKRVPSEARLAIFSDDPAWATRKFGHRNPWVSTRNAAVVDLLLMAQCRWIVTANSSFSWWSGWLNSRADKTIIAPRYHLGWRIGQWVPGGIAVPDWDYIPIENEN
jgi:hypothetical protein